VTDQLEWDHLVRMGPRERGLAMSKNFREILVDAWYDVHNLVGEGFAMQLPSGNHGDVAMWFQGFSGFD
jgi:hypothetical protein